MHLGIRETIKRINEMLRSHYAYYGITGNYDEMFDYYQYVQEMLSWTKTRRSQRKNKYIDIIKKVL